jgi:mannosyltransferase
MRSWVEAARLDRLTIAAPCSLAAALAVYELRTRSLWLDEAATVSIVSQHGSALWHAIAHDGGNMLAYYLLMHALVAAFGDGQVAIRLPSVIATVATVGLVAILGRALFDRRVAFWAGVIAAVSLPLIYWAQQARGYALMVTFAAASFLAFVEILQAYGERVPRPLLVAYALTTLLAIYMALIAVLIVFAQLAVLVSVRRHARAIIAALAAVAVCCVPLLVLAVQRGSGQLFWVPAPTLSVLGQAARTLTSAGLPPNFHTTATGTAALIVLGALLLAAVVALARASRSWPALLVVSWLLVPSALALLASLAGEPVELARSSVLLMPAVALALAWALHHPRVPLAAGCAGIAVVLAVRAFQLVPSYGVSPEPWETATSYVLAASRGGACVAFYPQDGRMPFDYYVRPSPASRELTPVLPSAPWSQITPYVERYAVPSRAGLAALARRCQTLWLLASHQGQRHGPPQSRVYYRRYRALLAALAGRYARQRGRSFGWAAVIRVWRFSRH